MEGNIIPTASEYEKLLQEISALQAEIVRLTALRDDLVYRICPSLRARLLISDNTLQIYCSTDLIAVHELSQKRLNYQKDHYQQLLSMTMKDADMVAELAKENLRQMDQFL